MRHVVKMLLPAAVLAVGLSAGNAEAAPAGNGLAPLKAASGAGSAVENAYWVRRCHRTRWGVRCHRVWVSPRPHWRRHWRRW
ncbi:MAG: hypothetical protein SFW09_00355 [Hyphomicrobiaceae bacterium]|nr:hypothetical protein [Hyphomicrobiaceae bacterium]